MPGRRFAPVTQDENVNACFETRADVGPAPPAARPARFSWAPHRLLAVLVALPAVLLLLPPDVRGQTAPAPPQNVPDAPRPEAPLPDAPTNRRDGVIEPPNVTRPIPRIAPPSDATLPTPVIPPTEVPAQPPVTPEKTL